MTPLKCEHPTDQRWQYPEHWLCCVCLKEFWGRTDDTSKPISYGRMPGTTLELRQILPREDES